MRVPHVAGTSRPGHEQPGGRLGPPTARLPVDATGCSRAADPARGLASFRKGRRGRGDVTIDGYLAELERRLPPTRRRRFLAEAEEHLRDAAARHAARRALVAGDPAGRGSRLRARRRRRASPRFGSRGLRDARSSTRRPWGDCALRLPALRCSREHASACAVDREADLHHSATARHRVVLADCRCTRCDQRRSRLDSLVSLRGARARRHGRRDHGLGARLRGARRALVHGSSRHLELAAARRPHRTCVSRRVRARRRVGTSA